MEALAARDDEELFKGLVTALNELEEEEISRLVLEASIDNILPDRRAQLYCKAQRNNMHLVMITMKEHFKLSHCYLGVDYERCYAFDRPLLIYQEPLQTTGDMYHLIAYIALSLHYGYDLPKLFLTYDTNSTKLPYLRNMALLEALDFAQYALLGENDLDKDKRCSSNSRRKAVIEAIDRNKYIIMDQKVTTQILVEQVILADRENVTANISEVIAKRIADTIGTFPQDIQHLIITFGDDKIELLRDAAKPILIHRRVNSVAPGSNDNQNMRSGLFRAVKKKLEKEGHTVITVLSSDMKRIDGKNIPGDIIQPFSEAHYVNIGNIPNIETLKPHLYATRNDKEMVDIGKIIHIKLFLRLLEITSLRVIGNTSGTTDIISFLGLNVINVHAFKNDIEYCGYRMLMQTLFFTVIPMVEASDVNAIAGDIFSCLKGTERQQAELKNLLESLNYDDYLYTATREYRKDSAALSCIMFDNMTYPLRSTKKVFDHVKAQLIQVGAAMKSITV